MSRYAENPQHTQSCGLINGSISAKNTLNRYWLWGEQSAIDRYAILTLDLRCAVSMYGKRCQPMSENERLREALSRACDNLDAEGLDILADELREALAAEPETCEWHRKTDTGGDPYGPWITSCGNEWDLQGPEGIGPFEYPDEYGFEFCPFSGCGRKIEVRE